MSTVSIPVIEGDKKPVIGFALHYELKVDAYFSVRWRMLNKDGTPLNDKDMRFFAKVNTPYVDFIFLDSAAKQDKILEAWYRMEEGGYEIRVAISISPDLGPPAILTTIWQNAKGQDISNFSLETVCLAIRTVNIPVGRKLKVLLYDQESIISDKFAREMSVSVGENGKALLKITREAWLGIRKTLKSQKKFGGEDGQYQIYARVVYDTVNSDGHSTGMKAIEKKTSVLIMDNDSNKSLEALTKEIGSANKSVVVNVPDKRVQEDKIPVDLRIDVYFDGTMGNRWNIDAKEAPGRILDDGSTAREKLQKNKAEHMLNEEESSYDQVYTNIPIMFDLDNTIANRREFKVYVEGVGSRKYGEDEVIFGAGLGTDIGGTSIPAKKQRMLDEIKNKVKLEDGEMPGEVKIAAFGFSRGAATARSFLSHRGDIARVLETSEANISFEFVGIFDTVSSVLIPTPKAVIPVPLPIGPLGAPVPIPMPVFDKKSVEAAKDNVKGFNLAVGANAKRVVHLTAGDEYRSFFKSTNIASSIGAGVGFELELPGCHCDIGGGDKDNITERLWADNYKGLVDRLIKEGWHTERKSVQKEIPNNIGYQVSYTDPFTGAACYGVPSHISQTFQYVERTVKSGYHIIPMSIIMDFAKMYAKINYDSPDESYPIPTDLKDLSERMFSFAKQQSGKRRASAMHILNEPQFKWIRNKYLHLSAFPESGKTKAADIAKDIVLGRSAKEELKEWLPFVDGDYSKRPERGINEG